MDSSRPLQEEIAHFEQIRARLLADAKGKFALVKGRTLVGVFDNATSALERGYRDFGTEPFLVREIQERQEPVFLASFIANH